MIFEAAQIFSLLRAYKYILLFPATLFEGPVITVIAGYLSSLKFLNFFVAYAVVVAGDTVGDLLYYAAGRWGRWKFFRRWQKLFDTKESKIAKMEKYFGRHAGKTLFFGKFGYGVVGSMLFASGLADVSLSSFLIFTFPATLMKSMMLLLVGFYFGYAYKQIAFYLDYTSYIMIGAVIILLMLYFYLQKRAKKILENNNTTNL